MKIKRYKNKVVNLPYFFNARTLVQPIKDN
nr:MAG TPA: hypothetical protein [Caudoviricetes sp.]